MRTNYNIIKKIYLKLFNDTVSDDMWTKHSIATTFFKHTITATKTYRVKLLHFTNMVSQFHTFPFEKQAVFSHFKAAKAIRFDPD